MFRFRSHMIRPGTHSKQILMVYSGLEVRAVWKPVNYYFSVSTPTLTNHVFIKLDQCTCCNPGSGFFFSQ